MIYKGRPDIKSGRFLILNPYKLGPTEPFKKELPLQADERKATIASESGKNSYIPL